MCIRDSVKSLHHQEVTSLESFKQNRIVQPGGLQQKSPYPSFINGKVEGQKPDNINSTLPQLVQKAGNSQTINQGTTSNMNILSQVQGNQQYISNFSRSQSRLKQANKNIFNQFKNVVNLNGQVEKGFSTYNNIGMNQVQQVNKPSFIGATMGVNAKGPMMVPHHLI